MNKDFWIIDTVTKYFYDTITRIKRNKSQRDKDKLKKLTNKIKDIEKRYALAEEEFRLAQQKAYSINHELYMATESRDKIIKKYSYSVRTNKTLNPDYTVDTI
jgi:hypothetical protein